MKRGHINHVVSGERPDIKASTLLNLSIALGVTSDWLLTGEGPIERPLETRTDDQPDPRATLLKRNADDARAAGRASAKRLGVVSKRSRER